MEADVVSDVIIEGKNLAQYLEQKPTVVNSDPVLWDPENPKEGTLYRFGEKPIKVTSFAIKRNTSPHSKTRASRLFSRARLVAISVAGFVFKGKKEGSSRKNSYLFVLPHDSKL